MRYWLKTVRHLLTHTSGIKGFIGKEQTLDPTKDIKPEDVIESVRNLPLKFPPGEKYSCSNTGYHLLGLIIRQVTGKDWGDFVRERILDPLDMRDTRVISPSDSGTNFAAGYFWRNGKFQNGYFVAPTILAFAGGGLLSTVLDLAKWDAALYTDKLLKKSSLDQMWTAFKLKDGSDSPKAICWSVTKYNGHRLICQTGSHNTGFMSAMLRFMDDKLTVIVLLNLANANRNGVDIAEGVAAFYIPGLNETASDR